MKTVHTLNSSYEIDEENQLVRRVVGVAPTTDRFTPNNEWKPYVDIELGAQMVVQWPDGQPELRDFTVSSNITRIEEA